MWIVYDNEEGLLGVYDNYDEALSDYEKCKESQRDYVQSAGWIGGLGKGEGNSVNIFASPLSKQ